MALLNPLFLQAVTGDPAITYAAQDYRSVISTLAPFAGTVRENDLKAGPRAAGANMSVDVAAGKAIVAGTSVANQGTYIVQSTAVENVPLATADATNPRIDLIVAQVYDKQADGGTRYAWQPIPVTGTPASSPVAPAVPPNALLLAEVRVNAGVASVSASNITDRRILSGTGDVPKWDFSGTPSTAQTVATGQSVKYAPATTFQIVGMGTTATVGEVVCRTPGRYAVHFGIMLATSTNSGPRAAVIELRNSGGTLLRRVANTFESAQRLPNSAAGTIYMRAGERMTANIFQSTGQTLAVEDLFFDANFTGVWVGP
jgi:hypothetical protein